MNQPTKQLSEENKSQSLTTCVKEIHARITFKTSTWSRTFFFHPHPLKDNSILVEVAPEHFNAQHIYIEADYDPNFFV